MERGEIQGELQEGDCSAHVMIHLSKVFNFYSVFILHRHLMVSYYLMVSYHLMVSYLMVSYVMVSCMGPNRNGTKNTFSSSN